MDTSKIIESSCGFISNVSCYDVTKDFIGPVSTLLVVIITVLLAFHKISKNHKNSLDAQKEESKRNTRIELFKDINNILDQASSVVLDISTFCNVKKYSNLNEVAIFELQEYLNLSQKLNQSLLSVVSKVESHEIINQKLFMTFRYSLQSIVYDVMKLQKNVTSKTSLDLMIDYTSDASCYLADFQVCMQNIAYSEIFELNIPHRTPIDKRSKVITNNQEELDKLLIFFSEETNWGKT